MMMTESNNVLFVLFCMLGQGAMYEGSFVMFEMWVIFVCVDWVITAWPGLAAHDTLGPAERLVIVQNTIS